MYYLKIIFFITSFFFSEPIFCQNTKQNNGCLDSSSKLNFTYTDKASSNNYNYTDKNGNVYFIGAINNADQLSAAIFKMNNFNKIIWKKMLSLPGLSHSLLPLNIVPCSNGDLLIAGSLNTFNLFLIRLTANGIILWSKNYQLPNGGYLGASNKNEIGILDDKESIYLNTHFQSQNGIAYNSIIKLDDLGNLIWDKGFYTNRYNTSLWENPIIINKSLYIFGGSAYNLGVDYETSLLALKLNKYTGTIEASKIYKLLPGSEDIHWNSLSTDEIHYSTINHHISIWGNIQNLFAPYSTVKYPYSLILDSNLNIIKNAYFTFNSFVSNAFFDVNSLDQTLLFIQSSNNDQYFYHYNIIDTNFHIIQSKKMNFPSNLGFARQHIELSDGLNTSFLFNYYHHRKTEEEYIKIINTIPSAINNCFPIDTTVALNQHSFTILPTNFSWDSVYSNILQSNTFTLIENELLVNYQELCKQRSICDTIKLHGDTAMCLSNSNLIFTVYKNPQCLRKTLLQADTNAVKIISQPNDTTFLLQFVKPYKGKIYASFEGCDLKDSLYINIFKKFEEINLGNDTTLCFGQSLLLNAKKGFKNYRWQDGSSDSVFNVNINSSNGKAYYVTATDYCGNQFTDTIKVNYKINQAINLGNDTSICINQSLLLDAGKGFIKYRWDDDNLNQTLLVNKAGDYHVIAIDSFNCLTFSNSINVITKPIPSILLNKTKVLCLNQNNIIHAGSMFHTYLWQDGSTDSNLVIITPGLYKVTVSNAQNCFASDSVVITNIANAPTNFLPADTAICKDEPITIQPTQTFSNYLWDNGSTRNAITISKPGKYWLLVKDKNSCIATDTINVIQKDCEDRFFIPTSFTPNNDGLNDIFKPTYTGRLKLCHLILYNRWGQKIFESNSVTKGWDGRFAGILQEQGAYIWHCTYQFKDKPIETKKGTCMLLH